jgi:hypothetical protein
MFNYTGRSSGLGRGRTPTQRLTGGGLVVPARIFVLIFMIPSSLLILREQMFHPLKPVGINQTATTPPRPPPPPPAPTQRLTGGGFDMPARTFVLIFISHSFLVCTQDA